MESIIKTRILKYIEEQPLLGKNQHGFWKRKSCITNLLELFEKVNKHADMSDQIEVIYLGFLKAFVKVPTKGSWLN